MQINHDIHIHTWLSACSGDTNATVENYIKLAANKNLKLLGFANHFWDSTVPGASEWYKSQDFNHIMQIKKEIPRDTLGIKVLIGCEAEYCGGGKVGISENIAHQLDYVLISMSHTHMKDFVIDEKISAPKDIARLLVARFKEVVELGLATGIAHPFHPVGFNNVDEILSYISDEEFRDCFGKTAELGVSLELNADSFPGNYGTETDSFHDETFLKIFTIAKECGCLFHFGSDAHSPKSMNGLFAMQRIVDTLGITGKDILPICRI